MSKVAFNGFLFSQRQTGTMRYAREILKELDKIADKDEFCLVVPEYAEKVPEFKNIKIVRFGSTKGSLWEQWDFPRYLRQYKKKQFNFNNTFPIFKPGPLVIYDIAYKLHPEFGTTLHGKISNVYHWIIFAIAARKKFPIVTDSYFSKYQLIDFYHVTPERIAVIGSAWQHFNEFGADNSILDTCVLEPGKYYFTLSSLSIMKNTKWVIEVAKRNPDELFVVSGGKGKGNNENFTKLPNIVYTGYITNEQIKALMQNCKAFIYPSIYDGFGLPPLEALSQGARVICSNAACLPEVYGNCVHYIDPYDVNVDLEAVLAQPVDPPESALRKYSWEKSAKKLYALLQEQV